MSSTLLDHIASAEHFSRQLDPSIAEFKSLLDAAIDFCAQFISDNQTRTTKSFFSFDEDAAWLHMNRVFSKFPEKTIHNDDDDADDADDGSCNTIKVDHLKHLLSILDKEIVRGPGLNVNSPRTFGYIPGGGVAPSVLGDLIAAVTNRFCCFVAAQPGPVFLETALVDWMASKQCLGFAVPTSSSSSDSCSAAATAPTASSIGVRGFFASGGSTATLAAITCARDRAGVFLGSPRCKKSVVYKTAEAHSCIEKALHNAGLSRVKIVNVETDPQTRKMNAAKLRHRMQQDRAAGLMPFLVLATVGTTNCGTVDPLCEIADVVDDYNNSNNNNKTTAFGREFQENIPSSSSSSSKVWFHIDGAYGGFFALARPDLFHPAFSRADSLVCDPHKSLYTPLGCALLLVRDGDQLRRSHSPAKPADYLNKDTVTITSNSSSSSSSSSMSSPAKAAATPGSTIVDSTELSLELSKHNRLLRLWIPLQVFGVAPYRAALQEKLLLAEYLSGKLAELSDSDMMKSKGLTLRQIAPQLSIVVFRVEKRKMTMKGNEDDVARDISDHTIKKSSQQEQESEEAQEEDANKNNQMTMSLESKLISDGRFFLSPTTLDGLHFLRVCILSYMTHRNDIDEMVALITELLLSEFSSSCDARE